MLGFEENEIMELAEFMRKNVDIFAGSRMICLVFLLMSCATSSILVLATNE